MICRFVAHQKYFGNDVINVFYAGQLGDNDLFTPQEVAEFIATQYETHLAPEYSPAWMLQRVSYQDIGADGLPVLTGWEGEIAGEHVGEPSANQVSVCVVFRGLGARPNKSIKFLGGWRGSVLDADGKVDTAARTAADNWATAMRNMEQTIEDWPFVVARFYPGTSHVHIANRLERHTVSTYPGTQRRRRQGVGS